MDASMNQTSLDKLLPYNKFRMSDYEILTWGFVFIPMIMISDVANLIVIWIILSHKSMRKVTNYFIVNLSFADILITTFNVPINYFYMTHANFPFGEIYCVFWNVIAMASMTSSVFTLTAIAFDRYRAILYPLEPRFSRVTSLTAIAVIWVLAILVSFPYITYSTTHDEWFQNGEKTIFCTANWPDGAASDSTIEFAYNMLILIFVYAIPMLVIATLYSRVGKELERSHPVGERVDTRLAHRYTERKKIIRMLRTVVVFFAICWLPYHVYFLVIHFFPYVNELSGSSHAFLVIYLLAMSNAMFNPIIYVWMNNSFRRGFRNFLLCRCSRGIYSSDPSELDRSVITSLSQRHKKNTNSKSKHRKHPHHSHGGGQNVRSTCPCQLAIESCETGHSSPTKGLNQASGSTYVTNTPNGSPGGNLNSSCSSPSPAAVTFALNDTTRASANIHIHSQSISNSNSKEGVTVASSPCTTRGRTATCPLSNNLCGHLSPSSSVRPGSFISPSCNNSEHLLMVSFDTSGNKCTNKKICHPSTLSDLSDSEVKSSKDDATTKVSPNSKGAASSLTGESSNNAKDGEVNYTCQENVFTHWNKGDQSDESIYSSSSPACDTQHSAPLFSKMTTGQLRESNYCQSQSHPPTATGKTSSKTSTSTLTSAISKNKGATHKGNKRRMPFLRTSHNQTNGKSNSNCNCNSICNSASSNGANANINTQMEEGCNVSGSLICENICYQGETPCRHCHLSHGHDHQSCRHQMAQSGPEGVVVCLGQGSVECDSVCDAHTTSTSCAPAAVVSPIVIPNNCSDVNEATCLALASSDATAASTVATIPSAKTAATRSNKEKFTLTTPSTSALTTIISSRAHFEPVLTNCRSHQDSNDHNSPLSSPLTASLQDKNRRQKKPKKNKRGTASRLASLIGLNLTRIRSQPSTESSSGGGNASATTTSLTTSLNAGVTTSTSGGFRTASPSMSDCAISSV